MYAVLAWVAAGQTYQRFVLGEEMNISFPGCTNHNFDTPLRLCVLIMHFFLRKVPFHCGNTCMTCAPTPFPWKDPFHCADTCMTCAPTPNAHMPHTLSEHAFLFYFIFWQWVLGIRPSAVCCPGWLSRHVGARHVVPNLFITPLCKGPISISGQLSLQFIKGECGGCVCVVCACMCEHVFDLYIFVYLCVHNLPSAGKVCMSYNTCQPCFFFEALYLINCWTHNHSYLGESLVLRSHDLHTICTQW